MSIRSIFACALVGTFVVACSAGDADTPGARGSAEPAAASSESLTVPLDNQVAYAEKLSAREVSVQILSEQGAPRFSIAIRLGQVDEPNIEWQLHEDLARAVEAADVSSGNLVADLAELPTLEQSVNMAAYMQTQITESIAGQEHDNWGCDLPFNNVASCGGWGLCCDIHDACFARFRCKSSSWWNPFASVACKACNAGVVACIGGGIRGPSVCCARGNCGQPR